jgi:hypothetical protein
VTLSLREGAAATHAARAATTAEVDRILSNGIWAVYP